MKRLTVMLLVCVVGGSAALSAQAPLPSVPQTLSLEEAVDLAVRYNPLHRQVENDHGPAAWGTRNAYAAFLPTFGLSGTASYSGAGSQNFFGSISFQQPSASIGSSYSAGFNWTLSGRTFMQLGLSRAQLKAADAAIVSSEINLESTVRQQYLTALQAEAQLVASEVQVVRNGEFLDLAEARYSVGQNTMLDVRNAQVLLGQARVALLRDRQAVLVEKLRLFEQIGVPAPTDPSVVTLSDTFPIVEPEWELEALLADAADNNPDLTNLRAQESSARANERAVKSDWLPTLFFSAGWSGFTQQFTDADPFIDNTISSTKGAASANFQACNVQNQIFTGLTTPLPTIDCDGFMFTAADEAGLRSQLRADNSVFPFNFTSQPFSARMTVQLPIFTQFSRPLQNAQASAQADDARETVRARQLQVRTLVSQAYYGLLAAYEAIDIQEQNQVAAGEQLRLARERYALGAGTFLELQDGLVSSEQAGRDYINAVYAYHSAIATLEAAVGRPLR